MFTKVLAMRLERFVPHIIDPDQVGFVKGRSSSDSPPHLFWQSREADEPTAAVSFNAETAFDRVELWPFSLDWVFIKWIVIRRTKTISNDEWINLTLLQYI